MPILKGLCLHAFLAVALYAQAGEGNALFQKQEWAGAAEAFQKAVAQNPADGPSWFRLGTCLHRLNRQAESRAAFQKAIDNHFQAPQAMATIARSYSMEGKTGESLEWLKRAAGAGFAGTSFLDSDAGFANVKADPGYLAVRARADANGHPCSAQGPFREFDFWVGEWDVQVGGQTVASSRIEKLLDGCVVQENWMPPNVAGGKSWNFYNAQTKKWEQVWISSGSVLKLEGGFSDGAMRLQGTRQAGIDRITFTPLPEHRVRQVWDLSTDGGKTWTVSFDGTYIPKTQL